MRERSIIIWAVLRLPLLLLFIIPFVPKIVTYIEEDFIGHSELYFRYTSTIPLRIQIGLGYIFVITCFYLVMNTLLRNPKNKISPTTATALFLLLISFVLIGLFTSIVYFYQVLLLLFLFVPLNLLLPKTRFSSWIQRGPAHQISDIFFSIVIIISEILLFRPFSIWLKVKTEQQNYLKNNPYNLFSHPIARIVFTAIICSIFLMFSFGTKQMIILGARLFSDPSLQVIIPGDYNGLVLDKANNTLFVSGHDTNHILAFDLTDFTQDPRQSSETTDFTQSFAFNPADQELYFYDQSTSNLVILDTNTLKLKEKFNIPPLSPGDVWIAWDKHTDQIVISSEAINRRKDVPMVIVNRRNGEFDQSREHASNILLNPDQPILYLASFLWTNELRVYDLVSHKVINRVSTNSRSNRMEFDPKNNELLIALPYKSAVLRYDKDTLEYKGKIKTMFGVRSLALDPERNLLLTGGLVTNVIDVIDLDTYQRIDRIYIGPWARTIVLDTETGDAYASTIEKVVKFHYSD